MIRITCIATAFAAIALAYAAPAAAAVKIETSLELDLPAFMPELKQGTIVILSDRTEWPVGAIEG